MVTFIAGLSNTRGHDSVERGADLPRRIRERGARLRRRPEYAGNRKAARRRRLGEGVRPPRRPSRQFSPILDPAKPLPALKTHPYPRPCVSRGGPVPGRAPTAGDPCSAEAAAKTGRASSRGSTGRAAGGEDGLRADPADRPPSVASQKRRQSRCARQEGAQTAAPWALRPPRLLGRGGGDLGRRSRSRGVRLLRQPAAADRPARGAEAAAQHRHPRRRRDAARQPRRFRRPRGAADRPAALSAQGLRRDRGPAVLLPIGVDPLGWRARFFRDIVGRGAVEGGSTLTQQLAKNLFLTQERTLSREIEEQYSPSGSNAATRRTRSSNSTSIASISAPARTGLRRLRRRYFGKSVAVSTACRRRRCSRKC